MFSRVSTESTSTVDDIMAAEIWETNLNMSLKINDTEGVWRTDVRRTLWRTYLDHLDLPGPTYDPVCLSVGRLVGWFEGWFVGCLVVRLVVWLFLTGLEVSLPCHLLFRRPSWLRQEAIISQVKPSVKSNTRGQLRSSKSTMARYNLGSDGRWWRIRERGEWWR